MTAHSNSLRDVGLRRVRLTEVFIKYDGPESLKAKISAGKENLTLSIANNGAVRWEGGILCSASFLTVELKKPRVLFLRKQVNIFCLPLGWINTSTISIHDRFSDVTINFTFSGLSAEQAAEDTKKDLSHALDKVAGKSVVLEKIGNLHGLLEVIIGFGSAVSDIHPAIKLVVSSLEILMKACEQQQASQRAASMLTEELDSFLSLSDRVGIIQEREESRKALGEMMIVIAEAANYISSHTSTKLTGDLFTQEYKSTIDSFRGRFAGAKASFILSLQVETIKGVHSAEQDRKLDLLRPVLNAHYKVDKERMCMEGTRVVLLEKVKAWLLDDDTSCFTLLANLLWLFGLAGSGKSFIANTIASIADKHIDIDLSCFFCQRDDPDLSNPKLFFRTLAFRIAQYYPSYRAALVDLLSGPNGASVLTSGIEEQFDLLFTSLLPKAIGTRCHVIVIDALDECGSAEEQQVIAKCLTSLACSTKWIKVFVTSRLEPKIRAGFAIFESGVLSIDINVESQTSSDIRQFILNKSSTLDIKLQDDQIDALVKQAAGLFIWCSMLFKYLEASSDPLYDLDLFVSGAEIQEPMQQLYGLYDEIIPSSIKQGTSKDISLRHGILGIVAVSSGNRALSIKAISAFLKKSKGFERGSETAVRNIIRSFHSVLFEDPNMNGAVRAYHPSFYDYLIFKLQNNDFKMDDKYIHEVMFKSMFAIMNEELKFNICNLHDSDQLNKDIADLQQRIFSHISEALRYSSLFWFSHLLSSGLPASDDELAIAIKKFFRSPQVFYWLEILSVLNAVSNATPIFQKCATMFSDQPDISSIASDLERFIMAYSEAMESVPHIYLSALSWLPEKTELYKIVSQSFKHLPVVSNKDENWGGAIWMKNIGSHINCVAYSPDRQYFATGSSDKIVRVWRTASGESVGEPLEGCDDTVMSISFSPDGLSLASGSKDGRVRIWDVVQGELKNVLEGHEGWVRSVAFSPDGDRLVSGSVDKTIRVWDASSGSVVGSPLLGHTGAVRSVTFSPDGKQIVSGSEDQTLRIWDTTTRSQVCEPLKGHSDWINSVACSQDGRYIASGAGDGKVRLWDAQTHKPIEGNPLSVHSGRVCSVCFSPDSKYVASGSWNRSIYVWELETRSLIREPFIGHLGPVTSIAISPDGQNILSGSYDASVRIWDLQPSTTDEEPQQGHTGVVCSVAVCNTGKYVVSASQDKSVRLWDAETGKAVGMPLLGHTGTVNSVAFSGDGRWLVSGSKDKTLMTWTVPSGTAYGDPMQGHSGTILAVAVSPDSTLIASASVDRTVRIWAVETRTTIKTLIGHTSEVTSVAFSPMGGDRIVTGSSDKSIRIWSTQDGLQVGQPLVGHTGRVSSVAISHNGQRVVSGSKDETVRIWDIPTSSQLRVLKGHTGWTRSVAFFPGYDSRYVLSGSSDNTLRIWDTQPDSDSNSDSGDVISHSLRGHSHIVLSVSISPDGKRIVSGSMDTTIRVWDTPPFFPSLAAQSACTCVCSSDASQAQIRQAVPGPSCLREHWKVACSNLDMTDGWIREAVHGDSDSEDEVRSRLLLWVPVQYRTDMRNHLRLEMGRHAQRTVKPVVDYERLYKFVGTRPGETRRWMGVIEGGGGGV